MTSDAELLDAWRRGDPRAGNELFERHYATVHRFLVNKVDDAEDLLQRTFEICAEGRDRFEGRSSFRSYLLGVARKLVLQHWERRRRSAARHQDIDEFSIHDLGAGPSTLMARSQEQRRMLEALRRLPLKHQVSLELYFWEELTGPELAEVLAVPEAAARSQLRRARLQLAEILHQIERNAEVLESTSDDLERWAASIRTQLHTRSAG